MKLLSGAVLASCVLTFTSCEGFDLGGLLGGNCTTSVNGSMELLTPSEQKAKLDSVGVKVLDACPAEDVEDFFDFGSAFVKEYIDRDDEYDFDALFEFGEDAAESSRKEYKDEWWYDSALKQSVNNNVWDIVVVLSNHKGDFTFGKNALTKDGNSTYDGVRVKMPLRGKNYEARLNTSGKTTKAFYRYLYYSEYNNSYGYWDENADQWVSVDGVVKEIYQEDYKFEIHVPENIEIGIYEDGNPMATLKVKTSQSFSAAGLDPTIDNINYDVTVFLNNGYEIDINDIAYDGAKGTAGGAFNMKKDGKSIVSASVSGQAQIENITESEQRNDEYDNRRWEETSVKVNYANNIDLLVDILGEVQLKGTCSDVKELNEAIDKYYDELSYWDDSMVSNSGPTRTPDEAAAARHLNNINAKLNLSVYYNYDYTKKQAHVEFEMSKERCDWDPNNDGNYNNDYDYDLMPVIVFNDNSRYTIEDYFTEEAFKNLLDKSETFAEGYDRLFGEYFDGLLSKEELQPQDPSLDFTHPDEEYQEGTR